MPTIFDNLTPETQLGDELCRALEGARAADACTGYLNLRGWGLLGSGVGSLAGGEGAQLRLLVGMKPTPDFDARTLAEPDQASEVIDKRTRVQRRNAMLLDWREQLARGVPSQQARRALQQFSAQLRNGQARVKLYADGNLHAKLYLVKREDHKTPLCGYVGSSNLTLAGLRFQQELNVDVVDQDAAKKLESWFEDRWTDSIDVTEALADVLEESWIEPKSPYLIYLKILRHIAEEADRADDLYLFDVERFRIKIGGVEQGLLPFQVPAVTLAARHVMERGGVILGDVVGTGKTMIATCVAKCIEEKENWSTLILCPKNLEGMWGHYERAADLRGTVLPISKAITELPKLKRHRLVIIDESHNLRNRESKTFRAVKEYIERNESKVVLLSATPYNKSFRDLYGQLNLFMSEQQDVGERPVSFINSYETEQDFLRKENPNGTASALRAFRDDPFADDWRDLLRHFMVRRTRGHILEHYSKEDESGRRYLELDADGKRGYFPLRKPICARFPVDANDPSDQYGRILNEETAATISGLLLPRYGLARYLVPSLPDPRDEAIDKLIGGLSRAGKRMIGFCRTGLYKRLESGGYAFIESTRRHIMRNALFIHALENGHDLPIGDITPADLDETTSDEDTFFGSEESAIEDDESDATLAEANHAESNSGLESDSSRAMATVLATAADLYSKLQELKVGKSNRVKWLPVKYLQREELQRALRSDCEKLLAVLARAGAWQADHDSKLAKLYDIITKSHPGKEDRILVFTQFADTAHYLERELTARGVQGVEAVSGREGSPVSCAKRFSPNANRHLPEVAGKPIRVLIATDVLSEGQNLQDCAIVVNYDLPWAIIRLIQRVGRVDRIGQASDTILSYSFLPAEGVERIIALRKRVRSRLRENAEVVGSDEVFFGDEQNDEAVAALYTEKQDILEDESEDHDQVDLTSYARAKLEQAYKRDPSLREKVEALSSAVHSASAPRHNAHFKAPGAIVFLRTGARVDLLVRYNEDGKPAPQGTFEILQDAECEPDAPAVAPPESHDDLVRRAWIAERTKLSATPGAYLGARSPIRRAWERLCEAAESQGPLFRAPELGEALTLLGKRPPTERAILEVTHIMRAKLNSTSELEQLSQCVIALHKDRKLIIPEHEQGTMSLDLLCSLAIQP